MVVCACAGVPELSDSPLRVKGQPVQALPAEKRASVDGLCVPLLNSFEDEAHWVRPQLQQQQQQQEGEPAVPGVPQANGGGDMLMLASEQGLSWQQPGLEPGPQAQTRQHLFVKGGPSFRGVEEEGDRATVLVIDEAEGGHSHGASPEKRAAGKEKGPSGLRDASPQDDQVHAFMGNDEDIDKLIAEVGAH